jgi:hypothetical protein
MQNHYAGIFSPVADFASLADGIGHFFYGTVAVLVQAIDGYDHDLVTLFQVDFAEAVLDFLTDTLLDDVGSIDERRRCGTWEGFSGNAGMDRQGQCGSRYGGFPI